MNLFENLEELTGNTVTEASLHDAIVLLNGKRRVLQRLAGFRKRDAVPISGKDVLLITQIAFYDDPARFTSMVGKLCDELDARARSSVSVFPKGAKRILLTGTPLGRGSEKVLRLLEDAGAVVVALENCTGLKGVSGFVDETGDPLAALARRYLATPCSCMSPNAGRFALLDALAAQFRPTGMVDLVWQACHTYSVESHDVGDHVERTLGLPFLKIETDYTESDMEQLRTRIEAFLELQTL